MQAARSSQTLVSNHHTGRRNNPENNGFDIGDVNIDIELF